jgi:hypothetical protein
MICAFVKSRFDDTSNVSTTIAPLPTGASFAMSVIDGDWSLGTVSDAMLICAPSSGDMGVETSDAADGAGDGDGNGAGCVDGTCDGSVGVPPHAATVAATMIAAIRRRII